jgi:hypothetical protein
MTGRLVLAFRVRRILIMVKIWAQMANVEIVFIWYRYFRRLLYLTSVRNESLVTMTQVQLFTLTEVFSSDRNYVSWWIPIKSHNFFIVSEVFFGYYTWRFFLIYFNILVLFNNNHLQGSISFCNRYNINFYPIGVILLLLPEKHCDSVLIQNEIWCTSID